MKASQCFVAVCLALLGLAALPSSNGKAQQRVSGFNQGAARPVEDPAVVNKGKALYGINCQACHGSDLRGGDIGGPNLLRSSVAMTDQNGENIVPVIQGARQAQGMPKIGIDLQDSNAVAAYVRSVIGTIGGQGRPPGKVAELDILVGNVHRGQAYFEAHCALCHSVQGDLRGAGTRYGTSKRLQAAWISGLSPAGAVSSAPGVSQTTATVTLSSGEIVTGTMLRMDDFAVTLRLDDGTRRSFRRTGNLPAVAIQHPAEAHRTMLRQYTDEDIHDVTAYLVTLR